MKRFVKGIEDALVAMTFAEIGEHGIAREFLAVPATSARTKTAAETHSRPHIPLVPEGDP
jgi:hypothetical protein